MLSLVFSLCLSITGCQQANTPPLLPGASPTTTLIDPSQSPAGQLTNGQLLGGQPANGGEASVLATSSDRQLVLWVPEFFQPHDGPSIAVLQNVYDQFRRNHPGVHLDIQIKAEIGDSSLFAYLRQAESMAPTILPDAVLLNTKQLWQAAELGIIRPMDWNGLTRTNDFFQFARASVNYQGQTIGVPYAADIIHLIYHVNQIERVPTNWNEVVAMGAPYLFAAGKQEYPNESLLLQYVGAGGQLFEDGTISSPDALNALFTFLAQAKAIGVLPEGVLELENFNETLSAFVVNQNSFADASARLMLAKRETLNDLGFAQIPTINGASITIAQTWAFALVTPDPEQQKLIIELIEQLLEPTVHSTWSRTTKQLPTQVTAYAAWLDSSPYYEFLQRQLDVAIAVPNGRPFANFARRLQQAQAAVLLNQLTVEDAVQFVQTAP